LKTFLHAIEGATISVTKENVFYLQQLCEEFGFESLLESDAFKTFMNMSPIELSERLLMQERHLSSVEHSLSTLDLFFEDISDIWSSFQNFDHIFRQLLIVLFNVLILCLHPAQAQRPRIVNFCGSIVHFRV
jgi:hypothetical protein